MTIKFPFSEEKALAALSFVASRNPGMTPLYVAKVFYFAEKAHLNKYGRPIIGDSYRAMFKGPVPSAVKNYIDEKWEWIGKPANFERYVHIKSRGGLRSLNPGRDAPRTDLLSETDMECLASAVEYCRDKTPDQLSEKTHLDRAWFSKPENAFMDYEDFVEDDNPHRGEIIESMKENAAYGVF